MKKKDVNTNENEKVEDKNIADEIDSKKECQCEDGKCCKRAENIDDENFEESEEVLILKDNIANLEEKLKAAHAEAINYRKRKDEEVANRLKFANQDIITDILPILDNFERALKFQSNDDGASSKFLDGIKMIYNGLSETLKKYGVQEIDCLGKEFDPNSQEAMLVERDDTKPNNCVLEVLIKGYMLKDRVIRAASVKVNKID